MTTLIRRLKRRTDAGATAVEYALMIGLIAVAIAGTMQFFGQFVMGLFTRVPPGL